MNKFVIITIIMCVIGCASYVENERATIDSGYDRNSLKSEVEPLLLAADLQVHYAYNSINTRTNFFDDFSESIRPAASDYFAPGHFKRKINEFKKIYPDGKMIILGDVLDVSCDWESDKFLSLMKKSNNWVLVPGNHDFIFLGTHEKKERSQDWINACSEKNKIDGRFNKVEFIFTYLETLASQSETPGSDPSYKKFSKCLSNIRENRRAAHDCLNEMQLQKSTAGDKVDRNCASYSGFADAWVNCSIAHHIPERLKDIPNQGWWKNDNPNEFIQDIFWYINPADEKNNGMREAYYSYSYILQRVRMPDGRYAVLLDTNNPAVQRSAASYLVGYNPANSANMLYTQMDAASIIMGGNRVWVKGGEKRDDLVNSPDEHVLMSHHPIKDYKFEAKRGLCSLVIVGNVKDIYTAHTHSPSNRTFKQLHYKIKGCENIQEFNIGSMIDYPIEYMILTKNNSQSISTTVDLSGEYDEKCSSVSKRWKKMKGTDYYYTSYNDLGWFASEKEIHSNLIGSLLSHFEEMLDKDEGFATVSANWPNWATTDSQINKEISEIKLALSNGGLSPTQRDRLVELGEFFSDRKVNQQDTLDMYKTCQLHWAAKAKSEL